MLRKLQVWKWSSVQSNEWTMHLSGWLDRTKLPRRYIYHCFICYHSSILYYMLSFIILLSFLKFTTGNVLFVPSSQAASLHPVISTTEGRGRMIHNTVLQYDNCKTHPVPKCWFRLVTSLTKQVHYESVSRTEIGIFFFGYLSKPDINNGNWLTNHHYLKQK